MAVLPGGKPSGPAQAVGGKLAASGALGPEGQAAAAASGAGAGSGKSRRPRRITADMSSAQVTDELQARRAAAAQSPGPAGEPSSPAGSGTTPPAPAPTAPAPPSSGAGPSRFTNQAGAPGWWAPVANPGQSAQAAANAGGGFLLGVFAWALGLAYLRGGAPEVRKLMAAKFLNKTA